MAGIPDEQGIDPNDLIDLQGRWGPMSAYTELDWRCAVGMR